MLSAPFSSLASSATSSNATSSNAGQLLKAVDIVSMSSGDTPAYSVYASVYDSAGKWVTTVKGTYQYSTASWAYYKWPDRPEGSGTYYHDVFYSIPKAGLPSSGNYGVEWTFNQGDQGLTWKAAWLSVFAYKNGVKGETTSGFGDISGRFEVKCTANMKIGYQSSVVNLATSFAPSRRLDLLVPLSEPFSFTFGQQVGGTVVSPDVSSGSSSAVDVQIEQGQQMIEKQENIIEQIINTTQTISNQLTAFWDQLAGVMTNLFDLMKSQQDDLLNADRENTEDIMGNQDSNTGKLVDKLEDTKTGIINGIIEGLKSLFIPSEGYFQAKFEELNDFFSERLGLLYLPFDVIGNLVDIYMNAGVSDAVLTFPGFAIMGIQVWPDIPFNLTAFLESDFGVLLEACRIGTAVIIVFNFLQLIDTIYRKVVEE